MKPGKEPHAAWEPWVVQACYKGTIIRFVCLKRKHFHSVKEQTHEQCIFVAQMQLTRMLQGVLDPLTIYGCNGLKTETVQDG